MNQAPLFESLKNTVSDKTDFCALLQPNLQEAPPTPAPSPPISKQPLPFLRPGLQHIPYFHHSFPGHALPMISHLAATGAIPIYSCQRTETIHPKPVFNQQRCVPSTTPSLFRIKTTFPSLLFLIHAASPKRFFSVTPPTAEGRILSSVSSPAEFLTSKPAQPRRTVPVPFSHSLCSLCVSFFSLLFPKNLQKKARRQHPYQLPDKPQRQPSEAVNPFLKILIKASEPLFSASPQSSGLAARASPAPPASSSHRSGFPPRSAARPSAWPVLPLHRSK